MNGTTGTENSGAASAGPTTFAEAFAADASSASSDTSQQTHTPSAAEQPTAASESQTAPADDRSPFIPRPRFDEVNGKYNELKVWKEQHGWVEQINQEQFQRMQEFYAGFNDPGGDPVALLQQLVDRISTHPEHGAKLRSLAAKQLAAARGQQQPQADEMPSPDVAITDGQGNVVGQTYSAEQLAKRDAFLQQQWLQQVRNEFEPVTKTVQEVAKERAKLEAQRLTDEWSGTFGKDMDTWPLMHPEQDKENRTAVGALVKQWCQAMPDEMANNPQILEVLTTRAWRQTVLPKLTSQAQSKLLDNLQHKAAASTGVNPGSAAASTPRTITKFSQLGPEAWR
jgi:hypothetical protein